MRGYQSTIIVNSFRKIAWTDLFIDLIKKNCKELNTEINMEQSITVATAVKDASLSLIISSNMAGSV